MTRFPVKIKGALAHDPDEPARQGLAPNADPDDVLPLTLAAGWEVVYQQDHGADEGLTEAIERLREVLQAETDAFAAQLQGLPYPAPAATPDPPASQ